MIGSFPGRGKHSSHILCVILQREATRLLVKFRTRPAFSLQLSVNSSEHNLKSANQSASITLYRIYHSIVYSLSPTVCEAVHVTDGLCGRLLEGLSREASPLPPVRALQTLWPPHCCIAHYQTICPSLHGGRVIGIQLHDQIVKCEAYANKHPANMFKVFSSSVRCLNSWPAGIHGEEQFG